MSTRRCDTLYFMSTTLWASSLVVQTQDFGRYLSTPAGTINHLRSARLSFPSSALYRTACVSRVRFWRRVCVPPNPHSTSSSRRHLISIWEPPWSRCAEPGDPHDLRTLTTVSSQSLCHVTGISMLRVLRTVRTLHERLETACISWGTTWQRHCVCPSLLNDTTWHLTFHTREQRGCLWRDPHAGGFLHHGDAQRNGPQTGNSFILYLWRLARTFMTGLSMCPDFCRKHSLVNSTLIATVTRLATIQQSASTQNQSFESLECKTRVHLTFGSRKSLMSTVPRDCWNCRVFHSTAVQNSLIVRVTFQSCTICLKCASSERDLSPPQMWRWYLQAFCWLACNYRWFTEPRFHSPRVGPCRFRASNGHEQYVPQLELVSVT